MKVDRSTGFRWEQKLGLKLSKRTERYLRRASLHWHVDEVYLCIGSNWRYLWHAVDANGQLVDFGLIARRDEITSFVGWGIERVEAFAGWIVGDHRLRPAFNQALAQSVTIASGGDGTEGGWRKWAEE